MTNTAGVQYLALRPLLSDYVLSMPRGAAVVYPKDAGQVVAMARHLPRGHGGRGRRRLGRADHVPAARGRRQRSACSASSAGRTSPTSPAATSRSSSAARTPPGGSRSATSRTTCRSWSSPAASTGSCSTCSRRGSAWTPPPQALAPGGVLVAYVATVTQLSRVTEAARDHGCFTEPAAWESLVRGWHLEGLAVRPQHRMVGHTGLPRDHPPAGRRREPARAPPAPREGHLGRRVDGRGPGRAADLRQEGPSSPT